MDFKILSKNRNNSLETRVVTFFLGTDKCLILRKENVEKNECN